MNTKNILSSIFFILALCYGGSMNAASTAYVANACWFCDGTEADQGSIAVCGVNTDGSLATCSLFTDTTINYPFDIALNPANTIAYIFNSGVNLDANTISICPVNTDGSLATCTSSVTLPVFYAFGGVHPNANYMYFVDSNDNGAYVCGINTDGTLGTCTDMTDSTFNAPNGRIALSPDGDYAYVANFYSTSLSVCPINTDGTFATCAGDAAPDSDNSGTLYNPLGVDIDPTGTYISIANSDAENNFYISKCTISSVDGSLSDCVIQYNSAFGTLDYVNNLFVANNGFSYIPNDTDNSIVYCSLNSDGTLNICTADDDANFFYPESVWLSNGK